MNTCFPVKLHHRTIAPSHRTQPAPLLTLQSTPSPSPPTLLTLQSTPFPSPPTLSSPCSPLPFPHHQPSSPCSPLPFPHHQPSSPCSALPFPHHQPSPHPAAHSLSLATCASPHPVQRAFLSSPPLSPRPAAHSLSLATCASPHPVQRTPFPSPPTLSPRPAACCDWPPLRNRLRPVPGGGKAGRDGDGRDVGGVLARCGWPSLHRER